jgi:hypothetical protein
MDQCNQENQMENDTYASRCANLLAQFEKAKARDFWQSGKQNRVPHAKSYKHFICVECNEAYLSRSLERAHWLKEHASFELKCPADGCSANPFVWQKNLKKHIAIKHPGLDCATIMKNIQTIRSELLRKAPMPKERVYSKALKKYEIDAEREAVTQFINS